MRSYEGETERLRALGATTLADVEGNEFDLDAD
jgi:hypothetical protein